MINAEESKLKEIQDLSMKIAHIFHKNNVDIATGISILVHQLSVMMAMSYIDEENLRDIHRCIIETSKEIKTKMEDYNV